MRVRSRKCECRYTELMCKCAVHGAHIDTNQPHSTTQEAKLKCNHGIHTHTHFFSSYAESALYTAHYRFLLYFFFYFYFVHVIFSFSIVLWKALKPIRATTLMFCSRFFSFHFVAGEFFFVGVDACGITSFRHWTNTNVVFFLDEINGKWWRNMAKVMKTKSLHYAYKKHCNHNVITPLISKIYATLTLLVQF